MSYNFTKLSVMKQNEKLKELVIKNSELEQERTILIQKIEEMRRTITNLEFQLAVAEAVVVKEEVENDQIMVSVVEDKEEDLMNVLNEFLAEEVVKNDEEEDKGKKCKDCDKTF